MDVIYRVLVSLIFCLIAPLNYAFFKDTTDYDQTLEIIKGRAGSIDELDPNDIKVMVWNIYKGIRSDWERVYKKHSKEKDLIIIQEYYSRDRIKKVLLEDFYTYYIAISWYRKYPTKMKTGVMTGAMVQPIRSFWHRSYGREILFNTTKMVLFNEFKLKGYSKTLMVVNIHALNFVKTSKYLSMLERVKDVLDNFDGPIIWAGDFNPWNNARFKVMKRIINYLGMNEVFFKRYKRVYMLEKPLDYIFVRGLKVKNSSINYNGKASDHSLLEASFKF